VVFVTNIIFIVSNTLIGVPKGQTANISRLAWLYTGSNGLVIFDSRILISVNFNQTFQDMTGT
jgi:hypothetical protein